MYGCIIAGDHLTLQTSSWERSRFATLNGRDDRGVLDFAGSIVGNALYKLLYKLWW
jgi:hypothetical protein